MTGLAQFPLEVSITSNGADQPANIVTKDGIVLTRLVTSLTVEQRPGETPRAILRMDNPTFVLRNVCATIPLADLRALAAAHGFELVRKPPPPPPELPPPTLMREGRE